MIATLFLSPPHFPFLATLKNPKPLNSLSQNATSFFLQNPKTNNINNINKNEDNNHSSDNNNNVNEAKNSENAKIKMPTPPWMKGPLLLDPDEVLDLSNPKLKKKVSTFEPHKADKSLTEKVSGRMGKKAMKKIVQSIEKIKLGGTDHLVDSQKNWVDTQIRFGDFGGGFLRDSGEEEKLGRKMPWDRRESVVFRRVKKEKVVSAAELSVDKEVLERLRGEASKMRKWVKVKKAGVTEVVVDEVHSIWANNELVMLRFDLPLCRNLDRAREIVEIKTGGLVVWSWKEFLVVYRGCDYHLRRRFRKTSMGSARGASITNHQKLVNNITSPWQSHQLEDLDHERDFVSPGLLMDRSLGIKPTDRSLYEREGDRLLEGLGPRFIDWWYPKPLPVDGDLLPEIVPGFKPPFRFCPPNIRLQLTDDELTYLRKLARPLPVHFVLGRNSKLEGLAVAILKLWEKSVIAKIAVKWGVPNTNNELMASELKEEFSY